MKSNWQGDILPAHTGPIPGAAELTEMRGFQE
jgi:hypothetical protein